MTKIDIFSGFLGSGKTTLIKKLVKETYKNEKIVLIENEFGEIGIDGGFLKDAGIQINEMNSGCICCSLVGDFGEALKKVMTEFYPDRIIIEPSGVGKLSDIITAVENLHVEDVVLNGFTTVVDAKKCKMYMKNFGEFFNNQVEHASSIILSHTQDMEQEKLDEVVSLLKEHNKTATIIVTEWDALTGDQILDAMERKDTLKAELVRLAKEQSAHDEHEHHHEHHDHEHQHEHHKHEHRDHKHGHHHADDIFDSLGFETTHKYNTEKLFEMLTQLQNNEKFGQVLRAKGIVESEDGKWIHFDYVPGEPDVRTGAPAIIGRLCVIGAGINQQEIKNLFQL